MHYCFLVTNHARHVCLVGYEDDVIPLHRACQETGRDKWDCQIVYQSAALIANNINTSGRDHTLVKIKTGTTLWLQVTKLEPHCDCRLLSDWSPSPATKPNYLFQRDKCTNTSMQAHRSKHWLAHTHIDTQTCFSSLALLTPSPSNSSLQFRIRIGTWSICLGNLIRTRAGSKDNSTHIWNSTLSSCVATSYHASREETPSIQVLLCLPVCVCTCVGVCGTCRCV